MKEMINNAMDKYLDNGNDPNVNDCYVNDPDSNAKFAWTV